MGGSCGAACSTVTVTGATTVVAVVGCAAGSGLRGVGRVAAGAGRVHLVAAGSWSSGLPRCGLRVAAACCAGVDGFRAFSGGTTIRASRSGGSAGSGHATAAGTAGKTPKTFSAPYRQKAAPAEQTTSRIPSFQAATFVCTVPLSG